MFIEAIDEAEAARITAKNVADEALDKFRASHSDFDEVFAGGINLNCHDGVTHSDVMHALSQAYTDQKTRLKRRAANAAEREALRAESQKYCDQYNDMIANGWTPPKPVTSDSDIRRRFKFDRQKDGSTIVEELD